MFSYFIIATRPGFLYIHSYWQYDVRYAAPSQAANPINNRSEDVADTQSPCKLNHTFLAEHVLNLLSKPVSLD
jgi:hypothetical protein